MTGDEIGGFQFCDYDSHGSIVVKALGYKPEGRRFETQWSEILNSPKPSGRTRLWSSLSLWQKWVSVT
jgi:hypothetical protein